MDGEEQPETFEERTPILPDEKFVQEKQKKITKKTSAKIDAKSLNNAIVAKRNEKKIWKDSYSKTLKKWMQSKNKSYKFL